MLCSIPTSKSSPSWLDRLHASKGFPVPSDLDLDHFLHSNSNPNPNPTPSNPEAVDPSPRLKKLQSQKMIGNEKEQRLFDLMSNVLSELFVMGNPSDLATSQKGARKQQNPRACVPSASASADGGASAMSPPSADNSVAEAKRDRKKMKRMRANAGQEAGSDPSVYTGTVVTVIDTSSPGWKAEKHFRKGMVWKGRDKKVWNVSRKKRKLGLVEKLIVEKERAERLRPLAELKGREQNENVESQNEDAVQLVMVPGHSDSRHDRGLAGSGGFKSCDNEQIGCFSVFGRLQLAAFWLLGWLLAMAERESKEEKLREFCFLYCLIRALQYFARSNSKSS